MSELLKCRECAILKPLESFHLWRRDGTRRRKDCRDCVNKKNRAWFLVNKDWRNRQIREQKLQDPVRWAEYFKAYRRKNKARLSKKRIEFHRRPDKYKRYLFVSIGSRIRHCRTYHERKLLFSYQEFIRWIEATQPRYDVLYQVWADVGFKRRYAPSIDRIDNARDYSLDNIQLLPFATNVGKDPSIRGRVRGADGRVQKGK